MAIDSGSRAINGGWTVSKYPFGIATGTVQTLRSHSVPREPPDIKATMSAHTHMHTHAHTPATTCPRACNHVPTHPPPHTHN